MKHQQVRYTESGSTAVVELVITATMTGSMPTPHGLQPPSGKKLNLRACDVVTVTDNRIAAMTSCFDNAELVTTPGILP